MIGVSVGRHRSIPAALLSSARWLAEEISSGWYFKQATRLLYWMRVRAAGSAFLACAGDGCASPERQNLYWRTGVKKFHIKLLPGANLPVLSRYIGSLIQFPPQPAFEGGDYLYPSTANYDKLAFCYEVLQPDGILADKRAIKRRWQNHRPSSAPAAPFVL